MTEEERTTAIGIRIGIVLLIPLIIAGIVILVLGAKMKSVAQATKASQYMAGDLNLTQKQDRYSHTTESRTRKKDDDDTETSSSGGFSGTSGKF